MNGVEFENIYNLKFIITHHMPALMNDYLARCRYETSCSCLRNPDNNLDIYTYFDFSFLEQLLSVWPDLDLDFRSLKLYWLIQNVKKNSYHDLICWYHEILNV